MPPGYSLTSGTEVVFETPDTHSHYFGYYDRCPIDSAGDKLLAHRVAFEGRDVTADDTATVGYFSLTDGEFTEVGTTNAFNWQQGSMLQWLPPDYAGRVIYNDRIDGSLKSVIADLETGESSVLTHPIYAIHPSGEFALTVNFERLSHCRPGYGYRLAGGDDVPTFDDEDDGIYRIDLDTGARELLVSLGEVCSRDPKPDFRRGPTWLTHLMWNPSGTRFAFYHRWRNQQGHFRSRLFTADADGGELFMFPDTGVYSHMSWRSDDEFTIWAARPSQQQEMENFVRGSKLLRSIVGPAYRFLRDRVFGSDLDRILSTNEFLFYTDQSDEFDVLGGGTLTEDGHISWSSDGHRLLTDTYTQESGDRMLAVYDGRTDDLHRVGSFHSNYNGTSYRCDLHPRWGRDEDRIIVDSSHDERRQIVVVEGDF